MSVGLSFYNGLSFAMKFCIDDLEGPCYYLKLKFLLSAVFLGFLIQNFINFFTAV